MAHIRRSSKNFNFWDFVWTFLWFSQQVFFRSAPLPTGGFISSFSCFMIICLTRLIALDKSRFILCVSLKECFICAITFVVSPSRFMRKVLEMQTSSRHIWSSVAVRCQIDGVLFENDKVDDRLSIKPDTSCDIPKEPETPNSRLLKFKPESSCANSLRRLRFRHQLCAGLGAGIKHIFSYQVQNSREARHKFYSCQHFAESGK